MSAIKRLDTSAKYSEAVIHNGVVYLAGEASFTAIACIIIIKSLDSRTPYLETFLKVLRVALKRE